MSEMIVLKAEVLNLIELGFIERDKEYLFRLQRKKMSNLNFSCKMDRG